MNTGLHASSKAWLDELTVELRLRDVSGRDIGDAVASAREFLTDTGTPAEDAFGPAREYADALALEPVPDASAELRRSVVGGLAGLLGFFAVVFATPDALRREDLFLSVGTLVLAATAVILLLAAPVYLKHIVRSRVWKVLLVVVVIFAVQIFAAAAFGAVAVAWVPALPVVLVGGVLLVGAALWAQFRTPLADPVREPMASANVASRSRRFLDAFPAWPLVGMAIVFVAIDVLLLGGS
jgi:hypothetical protein